MAAFAAAVRDRFPGCPPGEEVRVARYACRRGTGRVGSVAVESGYLDEAVELAVVAHLRHRFTGYEGALGRGATREQARDQARGAVSALLRAWRGEVDA